MILTTLGTFALDFGAKFLGSRLNSDNGGDPGYDSDVSREINRIKGIANTHLSRVGQNSPEAQQMMADFNKAISHVGPRDLRHDVPLNYAQQRATQLTNQYRQRISAEAAQAVHQEADQQEAENNSSLTWLNMLDLFRPTPAPAKSTAAGAYPIAAPAEKSGINIGVVAAIVLVAILFLKK